MDTDHCPKCDAKAVVAGHFQENEGRVEGRDKWFEPAGMRFFIFHLWRRGVSCP